jgi:hypothetical protein
MKKNLYLLLLLLCCAIPAGFAQLHYFIRRNRQFTTYRKEKTIVSFKPIGAILSCDENTTFKKRGNHQELTTFYFIDFNAEKKANGSFQQTTFQFKPTGNNSGTHELAIALGTINKQLHFPVLCVLNSENEIIFQHIGLLKTKELKILAKLKE